MARIRTIKPEIYTSEQFVELSLPARLLFIGMWNFCDDGGVHPDSPKRLKMEVFPSDDFTADQIRGMIEEMVKAGLLLRFEAEGQPYLWVTGWRHQKIDRPTFKHPRPPLADASPNDRRATDDGPATAPPRNGVESNGIGRESISIDRSGDRPTVDEFYEPMAVDDALWESLSGQFLTAAGIVALKRGAKDEAENRESIIRCVLAAKRCLPGGELDAILSRVKEALRRGEKKNPFAYMRGAFIAAFRNTAPPIDFHRAIGAFEIPAERLKPPTPTATVERVNGHIAKKPKPANALEVA